MAVEKLLLQLRGLQSPPEPGWWPLASGWWILFGLIALPILAYAYFRWQKSKQRLYQQVNSELQRLSNLYLEIGDSQLLLLSLSSWLKQVCIIAFPDKPVAAMTGQVWIEFLDQTLPGNNFTQGVGKVFAGEIYNKQQKVDSNAVLSLCNDWLLSMQPSLITAILAKHPLVSS